ncbi:MAG: nucleoside triphosphate pyrophosphohydrolase [Hyphomicrobiales bacterium]
MSDIPFDDLRSVQTLRAIMAALRTPVTGCPWDLEQSFETIAPYTIEEAYEVADAIERGDMADLRDELGDLLLQAVYHSQMAEETETFTFDDVVEAICTKLVRRHPHVFGDAEARTAGAVKGFWERIKAEERAQKQAKSGITQASVLDGVPTALPALMRAAKLQKKASRVGFDWADAAPVLDKIEEEIAELRHEMASGSAPKLEEELGDLLFAVANLARQLNLEPEAALQAANAKFTRRFKAVERKLAANGTAPEGASLAEMDTLWGEVKRDEQAAGS